jgi:hypothetical protein
MILPGGKYNGSAPEWLSGGGMSPYDADVLANVQASAILTNRHYAKGVRFRDCAYVESMQQDLSIRYLSEKGFMLGV